MRMRRRFLVLLVLGGLACPRTSVAQASSGTYGLQASGLVSAFRFERGPQAQWRPSSAIRLRAVLHDRVFGEFSYSAPITSEDSYSCLDGGTCDPDLTAWHFSVLSGGLGFFFRAGEWKPFVGASRGRFETEDESHGTWMVFSGLERSSEGWLGLVLEYRIGRVDWPYEGGVSLNHEIGVGLTVSVTAILGGPGSAP